MCVIIPFWCRIHCTLLGLVNINTGRCHVIWFYRCSYTGIWIQLNVSPSLFAYLDNSMCVIIHSWCRIHHTSPRLVYIYTGPCHAICSYSCSYTGISNQHNVCPSLFDISRQFDVHCNPFLVPYTLHVTRMSPYKHWSLSCHMILSFSYTGISNQHNVYPSPFDISRQFDVCYKPFLVPFTLHVARISQYKPWTLSWHMILLLSIYMYM
jgi:hypothetical protein